MFVIADDLTGAAEIAGIANNNSDNDVTVIATDTRSLTANDAKAETLRIIEKHSLTNNDRIFKKTDSALRGHIVLELEILMHTTGFKKCLLLPQNPSKGRTIKDGEYYINNTPLHETDFRFDPEFPAITSDVRRILKGCHYLTLNGELQEGINIAEAASAEDIRKQIGKIDKHTLCAGAADLFTEAFSLGQQPIFLQIENKFSKLLIVQGSTQSKDLSATTFFKSHNVQLCPMPDDVFDGNDRTDWIKSGNICLTIPQKRNNPVWCKTIMARTVKAALEESQRNGDSILLIIEGGATAFAVLNELGWAEFEVAGQLAPGVVAFNHHNNRIILKPGSYPWEG